MNNELVSIVVPIYNSSEYLSGCIESLITQTYKAIEILLIDDGSTDNSAEICINYSHNDNRIVYFYKENGGVSSARNTGIKIAKGKWLVFVDSDDYIDSTFVEKMLITQKASHVEYVVANYISVGPAGEKTINEMANGRFDVTSFLNNIEDRHYYCTNKVWGSLFLLSIINDNNIRFDEELSFKEDSCFTLTYLKYVKTVFLNADIYYSYRVFISYSLSKKIHKDIYEINSRVYEIKRETMRFHHCDESIIRRYCYNAILASIFYAYVHEHNFSFYEKIKTIKSVKKSTFVKQIRIKDVYGFKEKVFLTLLKYGFTYPFGFIMEMSHSFLH